MTGRNVLETEFADGAFVLSRQIRVGAAFDAAKLPGTPLTVAVDIDIVPTQPVGNRRVVAIGGEQWLLAGASAFGAGAGSTPSAPRSGRRPPASACRHGRGSTSTVTSSEGDRPMSGGGA